MPRANFQHLEISQSEHRSFFALQEQGQAAQHCLQDLQGFPEALARVDRHLQLVVAEPQRPEWVGGWVLVARGLRLDFKNSLSEVDICYKFVGSNFRSEINILLSF